MLVISRRHRETLELGNEIRITVLEIRPDQVRLGVQAPREVAVLRSELNERVRRANQEAAHLQPEDVLKQLTSPEVRLSWPVTDLVKARDFYVTLGFSLVQSSDRICHLQRSGFRLELRLSHTVTPCAFSLATEPQVWLQDPDGHRIAI